MNKTTVRYGLAAAAVLAIAVLGVRFLPGTDTGGAPQATATPSPTSTPVASASTAPTQAPQGADAALTGPLAAGTYTYYDVERKGFDVTFTVPAGWQWEGWYLHKDGVEPPDGVAIGFWTGSLAVFADPCDWSGTASVPASRSVQELMAALAAQPMRNASDAVDRAADSDVRAGAFAGMAIELTVPDDIDFADCDDGMFQSWSGRYHQGPGQRDLVWAIDVGGEQLIVDAASFPGTSEADRAELAAVLDSLTIQPGS